MKSKPVIVNGIKFKSASDAARYYEIPCNIVTQNIATSGVSAEQAINEYLARRVTFKGKRFRSLNEVGRYVDIPANILRARMVKGKLSLEQAVQKVKSEVPETFTAFDRTYSSVAQLASAMGVSSAALGNCIRKMGQSPEDALKAISKNKVTVFGVEYPSKSAAARKYGIRIGTVSSRMAKGMDLESALVTPLYDDRALQFEGVGKQFVVYRITNRINEKVYVGCTSELDKRTKSHFEDLAKTKNRPLYVDMRKFGVDNFDLEVLQSYKTRKLMLEGEIEWIAKLNSMVPYGYNLTQGGEAGAMRTAVTINGKYFPSARMACDEYGLSFESTQAFKREKNLTWKNAIETKLADWIWVNGKPFRGVHAFCKHFKIAKETLKKYLDEGFNYEQISQMSKTYRVIHWKGQDFTSIAKACRAADINESNVRGRIRDKGCSPLEAIEYFSKKKEQPKGYVLFGVHYATIKELLKAFDLSFDTYSRRRKNGMSIEEAVTKPNRIVSVNIDGKNYSSIANACRKFGISETDVYSQKKRGLSIEQAIKVTQLRANQPPKVIEFRGKTYPTKTALAKQYGRTLRSLNEGLAKGLSLEGVLLKHRRVSVVEVDGKKYPNKAAAYDAYNIPRNKHYILNATVRKGGTVEDAIKAYIKKK